MRENQDCREEEGAAAVAPPTKRIKSSEPDLSIIFRNDDGKEVTQEYHSVPMALHSNYFDTLLSSGMREMESKSVTLDDVDPQLFELAVEILEDPLKSASVTAEEILKVTPFYNRFEFTKGLKLAESVLIRFIDGWKEEEKTKTPSLLEMEMILSTIMISMEANLLALIEKSQKFLEFTFLNVGSSCFDIFDEDCLVKIKPFLVEYSEECLGSVYRSKGMNLEKGVSYHEFPQNLYWFMKSFKDYSAFLEMKLKAEVKIQISGLVGGSFPIFLAGDFFEKLQGQSSDGREVTARVTRLFTSCEQYSGECHVGDWMVNLRVGGVRFHYLWPCSRTSLVPPFHRPLVLKKSHAARSNENISVKASQKIN
jgi:hypothetical protein